MMSQVADTLADTGTPSVAEMEDKCAKENLANSNINGMLKVSLIFENLHRYLGIDNNSTVAITPKSAQPTFLGNSNIHHSRSVELNPIAEEVEGYESIGLA